MERQREKIRTGPLVVRDLEHPFAEDLITDEAGVVDPQLPVLPSVCFLGGRAEDGRQLWTDREAVVAVCANRRASEPVNTEVAWTQDQVLVGSVDFRNHLVSFLIHIVVLLLVYHRYWNAASNSVASVW